jgi:hypothetical protein
MNEMMAHKNLFIYIYIYINIKLGSGLDPKLTEKPDDPEEVL